jgi:acyl-CoA synthetase (AMP-forming)/AMP-acid ligase II
MVEEQISAGSGSTYFFTSLLDSPGFGPEHIELMRFIGLGGSPIPDAVAERADKLGISLVRSYGCTEHPSVTGSAHADPREKRIHTDGCPLDWVEVRIVDESGHDVEVGQPGEILSRGPDRFAGYTDPALSDDSIDADGWFRTGDVGVLDADGYLTITDRVKDVIIRGGENISAAEIEAVLEAHPDVRHAVAVGQPDPVMGERVVAFVEAPSGLDLAACRDWFARQGVARFKTPERVEVVDALPLLASGKPDRAALRARAAASAH